MNTLKCQINEGSYKIGGGGRKNSEINERGLKHPGSRNLRNSFKMAIKRQKEQKQVVVSTKIYTEIRNFYM